MKKVLEIGCGQGFNSFLLSKKNQVVGIDISRKDLLIAQKRYPKLAFILMNAEKLCFKNKIFDEIYAMDVLEHVNNLDIVLKEIRRCLKKNGQFITNIPYWKSEKWLLKIRPTYCKEIHHVRIFEENELDTILQKYNFRLIKKKRRGFLSHIELFFFFNRKIKGETQLGIGNWRDNYATFILHIALLFLNKDILKTPLRYFPMWLVTLPIGIFIDYFGNKLFPKSIFYQSILR